MSHKRRFALFAALTFALYSACGLVYGNAPRLYSIFGAAMIPARRLAGLALVAAAIYFIRKRPRVAARDLPAWLGSALSGAAAGVLLTGLFWNAVGAFVLSRAEAQVRRDGYSTEAPAPKAKIPDADNAAINYEGLNRAPSFADQKRRSADFKVLESFVAKALRGQANAQDDAAAQELTARHKDSLDMLAAGAAKSGSDWGLDWNTDPPESMRIPKYFGLVFAGRTLAARAILEARAGRHKEAVESVRLLLIAARSPGAGEYSLGALVEKLLYDAALDAARVVLRKAPPALAQERWGPLLDSGSMERGFANELLRCDIIDPLWYSRLGWWDVAFGKHRKERFDIPFDLPGYWPFLKLDVASALRERRPVTKTFALPPSQSKEANRLALDRAIIAQWIISSNAQPGAYRTFEAIRVGVAQTSLARAALSARISRERTGRWPAAASERDPFSDGLLLLKKEKDGAFVIYSVGPDGRDDQGAPFDENKRAGDLSWRL